MVARKMTIVIIFEHNGNFFFMKNPDKETILKIDKHSKFYEVVAVDEDQPIRNVSIDSAYNDDFLYIFSCDGDNWNQVMVNAFEELKREIDRVVLQSSYEKLDCYYEIKSLGTLISNIDDKHVEMFGEEITKYNLDEFTSFMLDKAFEENEENLPSVFINLVTGEKYFGKYDIKEVNSLDVLSV